MLEKLSCDKKSGELDANYCYLMRNREQLCIKTYPATHQSLAALTNRTTARASKIFALVKPKYFFITGICPTLSFVDS